VSVNLITYYAHVDRVWLISGPSAIAVAWVDQSKTLIAQGIELDDLILLKRRYFYSDQNIDARDPVQLNLLYVQVCQAVKKIFSFTLSIF
jgi:hypothetical protein